jgi:hypothetical protein
MAGEGAGTLDATIDRFQDLAHGRTPTVRGVLPWSFVYGFFSNGTPFDAPNRSETCPLA